MRPGPSRGLIEGWIDQAAGLGIQNARQLTPYRALMETWVVGELRKARRHRGLAANVYFWRDKSGHEVDVLLDGGDALVPVEVEPGPTVSRDMLTGLEQWRALADQTAGPAWLVYGGDQRQERSGCVVLPWSELGRPDLSLVQGTG